MECSSKPIGIRIQSIKVDDVSPEEVEINDVFQMLDRIAGFWKEASLRELFLVEVVFGYQMQFTLHQLRQHLHLLSQSLVPVEPFVNSGNVFHEFRDILAVNEIWVIHQFRVSILLDNVVCYFSMVLIDDLELTFIGVIQIRLWAILFWIAAHMHVDSYHFCFR